MDKVDTAGPASALSSGVHVARLLLLPLLALVACDPEASRYPDGTFDNTGGPPPAGVPIEYLLVEETDVGWCFHDSQILRTAEEMSPSLRACADESGGRVEAILESVGEGEYAVFLNVEIGGPESGFEVFDVHLDGSTFRPWIVMLNPSHGVQCPPPPFAFLFTRTIAFLVEGELPDAISPHFGVVNPDVAREAGLPAIGERPLTGCPGTSEEISLPGDLLPWL
jgi:hypothetical protein